MIGAKKAQEMILNRVPCICYPVQFPKDMNEDILTLLNFESKVNAIILAYMAQLDFKVQRINVTAQKIDKSSLET